MSAIDKIARINLYILGLFFLFQYRMEDLITWNSIQVHMRFFLLKIFFPKKIVNYCYERLIMCCNQFYE